MPGRSVNVSSWNCWAVMLRCISARAEQMMTGAGLAAALSLNALRAVIRLRMAESPQGARS